MFNSCFIAQVECSDCGATFDTFDEGLGHQCQADVDLPLSLVECISLALTEVEGQMDERPSRELALVRTKLEEAMFWASYQSYPVEGEV